MANYLKNHPFACFVGGIGIAAGVGIAATASAPLVAVGGAFLAIAGGLTAGYAAYCEKVSPFLKRAEKIGETIDSIIGILPRVIRDLKDSTHGFKDKMDLKHDVKDLKNKIFDLLIQIKETLTKQTYKTGEKETDKMKAESGAEKSLGGKTGKVLEVSDAGREAGKGAKAVPDTAKGTMPRMDLDSKIAGTAGKVAPIAGNGVRDIGRHIGR